VISGFSEADKKGIQNNPYQAEYRESAMKTIDGEGKAPSNQELLRLPLQELGSQLMDKLDAYEASLSYAGEGYNKIKQLNNEIDVTPAHAKVGDILRKYDIFVKPD
jgi:hypothetical protein